MNDLQIIPYKGKPVVDSRDVARAIGRRHDNLIQQIQKYIEHISALKIKDANGIDFKPAKDSSERKIASADFFIPSTYTDEQGKERPCYLLTRLGCDLVANKLTGEKGVQFTAAYVTRFYEMERELTARKTARSEGKPIRRAMTDAIRDSGENVRMKGHAYSAYENLVYFCALGINARKLRQQRAGSTDKLPHAVDLLSSQELERVINAENQITVLLDMGFQYDRIRELMNNRTKGAI